MTETTDATTVEPSFKVPYTFSQNLIETIVPIYEKHPHHNKPYFATFHIRAFMNDKGEPNFDSCKPRFVVLFSNVLENLNQAVYHVKTLFGDAVYYKLHKTDDSSLPEEYEDKNTAILLHRRSRALQAEQINQLFTQNLVDDLWNLLLKSQFMIMVKEEKQNGMTSYSATTSFRPSTADIIADSGILTYPSPIDAFSKAVESSFANYEEVIDKNFDTVFIDFTPRFKGELPALETNQELITLFKQNILASVNAEAKT